jgi:hypothetical protein
MTFVIEVFFSRGRRYRWLEIGITEANCKVRIPVMNDRQVWITPIQPNAVIRTVDPHALDEPLSLTPEFTRLLGIFAVLIPGQADPLEQLVTDVLVVV